VTFSFDDGQLVLTTRPEPPLPEVPEGRRPGYLGITGSDAEGGGVLVTQVQQGTVAGLSGLRAGDVILEVNGEKVANYGDLAAKMRLHGEGGPVTLRIRRGATEFYQGAQLGPRPP
jgi:S1-C subfamily serine protease